MRGTHTRGEFNGLANGESREMFVIFGTVDDVATVVLPNLLRGEGTILDVSVNSVKRIVLIRK